MPTSNPTLQKARVGSLEGNLPGGLQALGAGVRSVGSPLCSQASGDWVTPAALPPSDLTVPECWRPVVRPGHSPAPWKAVYRIEQTNAARVREAAATSQPGAVITVIIVKSIP